MKFLRNKEIKYEFPTKSGNVIEKLLVTESDMVGDYIYLKVLFINKKKYVEHSDKFHRFHIYNTVKFFLEMLNIEKFFLTIEEIHD